VHDNDTSEALKCTDSCCTHEGPKSRWLRALRHGFVTLPRDIAVPLVIGAAVAGAMTTFWPAQEWHAYLGAGLPSVLLLMVAAIPIYVCASASAPVAAGLIHLGASPGAALAFLIVGAATNPAALATVWKVLGRRTTILYLLTTASTAVICACLLNAIPVKSWAGQTMTCADCMQNQPTVTLIPSLWAAALLTILASSCLRWQNHRASPSSVAVVSTKPPGLYPEQQHGDCCHAPKLHPLGQLEKSAQK
jgi:hypothetical protein